MFQIRIHGRGGRGEVVTAAELRSMAALVEGRHTQASRAFGSGRAGAPVMAFCRIADVAIRRNEPVMDPDALIVQDTTLLSEVDVFGGLKRNGYLLLNSELGLPELGQTEQARWHPPRHVAVVPASQLAMRHTGRPVPTAAMLGAFAALTGVVSLESVVAAIRGRFGRLVEGSAAAATEAHDLLRAANGSTTHA
ncbi:2-oxoacid:acceptor oxidoreductase family protein [Jiangella muralis]|uniref:2-oxoacid:acceptor oxidoreductase family protein n=1 Tax=Jiangella muralis TaxID=702383 RepID=UPI00069F33EF|nr:2-oxoacid:acceptor oxidoreductase family protein [Jiangella muralis]